MQWEIQILREKTNMSPKDREISHSEATVCAILHSFRCLVPHLWPSRCIIHPASHRLKSCPRANLVQTKTLINSVCWNNTAHPVVKGIITSQWLHTYVIYSWARSNAARGRVRCSKFLARAEIHRDGIWTRGGSATRSGIRSNALWWWKANLKRWSFIWI